MVVVHHVIAGRKLERVNARTPARGELLAAGAARSGFARHVPLAHEHNLDVLEEDALGNWPGRNAHVSRGKLLVEVSAKARRNSGLRECLGNVAPGSRAGGCEDHPPAFAHVLCEITRGIRNRATIARVRLCV